MYTFARKNAPVRLYLEAGFWRFWSFSHAAFHLGQLRLVANDAPICAELSELRGSTTQHDD